jgi:hypothetical protein
MDSRHVALMHGGNANGGHSGCGSACCDLSRRDCAEDRTLAGALEEDHDAEVIRGSVFGDGK